MTMSVESVANGRLYGSSRIRSTPLPATEIDAHIVEGARAAIAQAAVHVLRTDFDDLGVRAFESPA